MSNSAVKSNNSVKSNLAGLEIVVGANMVPKTLYLLIGAQGNEVIDEPVSRGELIDTIIESEIIEDIRRMVADVGGCGCDHCYDDIVRELAEEMAIDAGYKIIEVLR